MAGSARDAGTAKSRNADRSRKAILAAAEELFAERGFEGVGLGEIAKAAGLSRGTPSYFFGSKAELYGAVLEEVFQGREEATRRACRPLVVWASSGADAHLRRPMTEAVGGYLDFLLGRPSFFKLIQREELAGAARLRRVPRESRAIEEAFGAVRSVANRRELRRFVVEDAVLLFVSLTFFPLAQRSTFMAALGRDMGEKNARRRHIQLAVDQLLHFVGSREAV